MILKGFLKELKNKNYKGYFSLDLDINWDEEKLNVPLKKQRRESQNYLEKLKII